MRFWKWLAANRYPILFALALVALTSLIAWWAIFINRALEERIRTRFRMLDLEARVYALMFGHVRNEEVVENGLRSEEVSVAISRCPPELGPMTYQLLPHMEHLCIAPRAEILAEVERDRRSKEYMLLGEASLSLLLVLVTGFMLYRLVATENRSAREIRDLWSRVTHEIKTPISGLKAFLQTLQTQDLTREELEPLVKMALDEVGRQERLAENLLVGQRLGGMPVSEPRRLPIVPFLRQYLAGQEFRLHTEQRGLTTTCTDEVQVKADPGALRTILDNLVDNAVKYCDKTSLETQFAVERDRKWVRVTVSDNGAGFDPGMAQAIFQAYKRLAQGGLRGTGLGLHISRRLARENGGDLTAESPGLGQGSRFTLWLPAV